MVRQLSETAELREALSPSQQQPSPGGGVTSPPNMIATLEKKSGSTKRRANAALSVTPVIPVMPTMQDMVESRDEPDENKSIETFSAPAGKILAGKAEKSQNAQTNNERRLATMSASSKKKRIEIYRGVKDARKKLASAHENNKDKSSATTVSTLTYAALPSPIRKPPTTTTPKSTLTSSSSPRPFSTRSNMNKPPTPTFTRRVVPTAPQTSSSFSSATSKEPKKSPRRLVSPKNSSSQSPRRQRVRSPKKTMPETDAALRRRARSLERQRRIMRRESLSPLPSQHAAPGEVQQRSKSLDRPPKQSLYPTQRMTPTRMAEKLDRAKKREQRYQSPTQRERQRRAQSLERAMRANSPALSTASSEVKTPKLWEREPGRKTVASPMTKKRAKSLERRHLAEERMVTSAYKKRAKSLDRRPRSQSPQQPQKKRTIIKPAEHVGHGYRPASPRAKTRVNPRKSTEKVPAPIVAKSPVKELQKISSDTNNTPAAVKIPPAGKTDEEHLPEASAAHAPPDAQAIVETLREEESHAVISKARAREKSGTPKKEISKSKRSNEKAADNGKKSGDAPRDAELASSVFSFSSSDPTPEQKVGLDGDDNESFFGLGSLLSFFGSPRPSKMKKGKSSVLNEASLVAESTILDATMNEIAQRSREISRQPVSKESGSKGKENVVKGQIKKKRGFFSIFRRRGQKPKKGDVNGNSSDEPHDKKQKQKPTVTEKTIDPQQQIKLVAEQKDTAAGVKTEAPSVVENPKPDPPTTADDAGPQDVSACLAPKQAKLLIFPATNNNEKAMEKELSPPAGQESNGNDNLSTAAQSPSTMPSYGLFSPKAIKSSAGQESPHGIFYEIGAGFITTVMCGTGTDNVHCREFAHEFGCSGADDVSVDMSDLIVSPSEVLADMEEATRTSLTIDPLANEETAIQEAPRFPETNVSCLPPLPPPRPPPLETKGSRRRPWNLLSGRKGSALSTQTPDSAGVFHRKGSHASASEADNNRVTPNPRVMDGSVINVRLSLGYLQGLAAKIMKRSEVNGLGVVAYAEVDKTSSLVTCDSHIAESNFVVNGDKQDLLSVVWSGANSDDKTKARLYFSVFLEHVPSADEALVPRFSPEDVTILVGLKRGDTKMPLGSLVLSIDGQDVNNKDVRLKVQPLGEALSKGFFGRRKQASFTDGDRVYSIGEDAALRARVDVVSDNSGMPGPGIWDDQANDEESFAHSLSGIKNSGKPPVVRSRSVPTDAVDAVEVVPFDKGSAIIPQSTTATSGRTNSFNSGAIEHGCCVAPIAPQATSNEDGSFVIDQKSAAATQSASGSLAVESLTSVRERRHLEQKSALKKKPNLGVIAHGAGAKDRSKPPLAPIVPKPPAGRRPLMRWFRRRKQSTPDDISATISGSDAAPSLHHPTVDTNHVSFAKGSYPTSSADEESFDEESTRSSQQSTAKNRTTTETAAAWLYRRARAAGLFSYSSDEGDKLTTFSFSTIDGTHMQTSDLSDSVATEEEETLLTEDVDGKSHVHTTLSASYSETLETDHENSTNPSRDTFQEFKKILELADKLGMKPNELIDRMRAGENLEDLLRR